MVLPIDDCRDCLFHVAEHGSVVICLDGGSAAARNVLHSEWGPAYVTDCPLARISETMGRDGSP